MLWSTRRSAQVYRQDPVEEKLKTTVKSATGIEPVGVTVARKFGAHAQEIEHAIDAELEEVHDQVHHGQEDAAGLKYAITNQVLHARHIH